MKPDKSTKIGAIMQIVPTEDHGYAARLLVVERIESWGVVGYISGVDGGVSRTWNLVEPTGGTVAFGRDGKPFVLPEPAPKHHE